MSWGQITPLLFHSAGAAKESHPHLLASQCNLAVIGWDLGRCRVSLQKTIKHVVGICRQVLDEHFSDWEDSESWLNHFQDEARNFELA